MSSLTANYDLIKPGVNDPTDQDLWGGYLNSDLDSIDSLLKQAMNDVVNPQSGNYVVQLSDINKVIAVDATAGNRTVSLPTAVSAENGFVLIVKKTDSSTNTVTIDPDGSETIDGDANYVLSSENDVVTIVSDGTNWLKETKPAPITGVVTQGGILVGNANGSYENIPVGTDGQVPTSNGTTVLFETPAISSFFESSELAITPGALYEVAHSFGSTPKLTQAVIKCTTADVGYSIGDEISVILGDAVTENAHALFSNATNVGFKSGSAYTFKVINKSTGSFVVITAASWRLVLRAWK